MSNNADRGSDSSMREPASETIVVVMDMSRSRGKITEAADNPIADKDAGGSK